jgi:hypothetical protein
MNPNKADAILSLRPGAQFVLTGGAVTRWGSPDIEQPTAQEIETEYQRLTAEYPAKVAAQEREQQRQRVIPRAIELAAQEVLKAKVLADEINEEDYPSVAALYREWAPGVVVSAGDILNRLGTLYEVVQGHGHTTQADWLPESTASLFTPHRPPGAVTIWVQPLGSHDAYPAGAEATHNGKTWTNTHGDGNVWEPGVFGWTEVT